MKRFPLALLSVLAALAAARPSRAACGMDACGSPVRSTSGTPFDASLRFAAGAPAGASWTYQEVLTRGEWRSRAWTAGAEASFYLADGPVRRGAGNPTLFAERRLRERGASRLSAGLQLELPAGSGLAGDHRSVLPYASYARMTGPWHLSLKSGLRLGLGGGHGHAAPAAAEPSTEAQPHGDREVLARLGAARHEGGLRPAAFLDAARVLEGEGHGRTYWSAGLSLAAAVAGVDIEPFLELPLGRGRMSWRAGLNLRAAP